MNQLNKLSLLVVLLLLTFSVSANAPQSPDKETLLPVSEAQFKIYPSATTGQFKLKLQQAYVNYTLTLSNLDGEKIFEKEIQSPDANYTLQLGEEFTKGIYIIKLSTAGESYSRKLMVR